MEMKKWLFLRVLSFVGVVLSIIFRSEWIFFAAAFVFIESVYYSNDFENNETKNENRIEKKEIYDKNEKNETKV